MKKIEYRKINRTGLRKDNKTGLGWCFNIVIPQEFALAMDLTRESIMRFTIAGKKTKYLKLEKA